MIAGAGGVGARGAGALGVGPVAGANGCVSTMRTCVSTIGPHVVRAVGAWKAESGMREEAEAARGACRCRERKGGVRWSSMAAETGEGEAGEGVREPAGETVGCVRDGV